MRCRLGPRGGHWQARGGPREEKSYGRAGGHYPEQNVVLRDLLPKITTPAQIVAGRDDDLVPWSNNQYLDDLLSNSEIHPLEAGHFAWEQAPDEYARLMPTGSAADIDE
jgi:pimeloyl-ACP methyl ester carboxylesterase